MEEQDRTEQGPEEEKDVEGHAWSPAPNILKSDEGDDVEAHKFAKKDEAQKFAKKDEDEDVEGHSWRGGN